jgi:hypothetical protein
LCYFAIKGHEALCGAAPGIQQALPCHDLRLGLVTVHLLGKSRRSVFLRILAFLGLAVCVFSWGLQYKLSLYEPPQATSHQVPAAKLLSRNEQSRATESPRIVFTRASTKVIYTAPTGVFLFSLLIPFILNLEATGQRLTGARRLPPLRSLFLNDLFVRPPPIFV